MSSISKTVAVICVAVLLPLATYGQKSGAAIKRPIPQSRVITKKSSAATKTVTKPNREKILENLINNMVYVEGGTYNMNSRLLFTGGYDNGYEVSVSSFYIAKYEVTVEEWKAVLGKLPPKFYVRSNKHPISFVSWNDCQIFIKKLNELTHKSFRLPTEAEWEYAARGGRKSKNYRYAGSDSINWIAWHRGNGGMAHKVGTKSPNELGLYDMTGNVEEWTNDWDENLDKKKERLRENPNNPQGPANGERKITKGSSFAHGSAERGITLNQLVGEWEAYIPAVSYRPDIGLRLVLDE